MTAVLNRALLIIALAASPLGAGEARYAQELPEFTLKDPRGTEFRSRELLDRGLILVMTAPTVSQGDAQEKWDQLLLETRPRGRGAPRIVFVEDLAQSWFPQTALKAMRKEYVPGQPPLVLVDREGTVRRKLGVPRNATVVMVFNKKGRRVGVEPRHATRQRALALWRLAGG